MLHLDYLHTILTDIKGIREYLARGKVEEAKNLMITSDQVIINAGKLIGINIIPIEDLWATMTPDEEEEGG